MAPFTEAAKTDTNETVKKKKRLRIKTQKNSNVDDTTIEKEHHHTKTQKNERQNNTNTQDDNQQMRVIQKEGHQQVTITQKDVHQLTSKQNDDNEDDDEAFFRSLFPFVRQFSQDQKLLLRIELIKTILNFKQSQSEPNNRENITVDPLTSRPDSRSSQYEECAVVIKRDTSP